jgi:hypothetical protein
MCGRVGREDPAAVLFWIDQSAARRYGEDGERIRILTLATSVT